MGRLIDVADPKMHMYCSEKGSPTVILVAGSGDLSLTWFRVQPELAKHMHVCSFDRLGSGWSDSSSLSLPPRYTAKELHVSSF